MTTPTRHFEEDLDDIRMHVWAFSALLKSPILPVYYVDEVAAKLELYLQLMEDMTSELLGDELEEARVREYGED